ncbi:MAG TPA: NAD(P)H-dependent oxidoreductase [Gemmatimonas aurantiaca]|uniref:NAD(P)H-dependent oxidoreductase n=2 Tax=Gemmatimonas aurantiaca TaxID=173480 RepID=A0A3D4VB21_9BACT|nr:NADPH-dependent FMN reductase [Gemmatimonas aurantiaca]BAH39229.1 putative soluble quinone reductase [Gemmatimonas aurantiaca T-27]HCT57527.1 NAD(P)H-dependent oxidoreductase [Gemmatimonas aurantiaca]
MSSTERPLVVCAIAGSLRQASYNRALLRAAQELAPEGMEIRIFDRVGDLPLFDQDLEAQGDPEPVVAMRRAIAEADALLIATPEYNHGVPGVLKNAIDWASRPPRGAVLAGKPTAILGASPGVTGTARAQSQLRQTFVFTDTPVLPQPEILVYRAHEKFDAEGRLTDERTREFVGKLLVGLASWTRRLGSPG